MPPQVNALFVIYDADGTRAGELLYIAKKLLGLAHCAACDITHGPRKEKPEFTQLKLTWPVPVHNIHRDEMDPAMAHVVHHTLPCVVARTDTLDVVVMRPEQLERCAGDVVRFATDVRQCVDREGLEMPERSVQACAIRIPRKKGLPKVHDDDSLSSNGDAVVPSYQH